MSTSTIKPVMIHEIAIKEMLTTENMLQLSKRYLIEMDRTFGLSDDPKQGEVDVVY